MEIEINIHIYFEHPIQINKYVIYISTDYLRYF